MPILLFCSCDTKVEVNQSIWIEDTLLQTVTKWESQNKWAVGIFYYQLFVGWEVGGTLTNCNFLLLNKFFDPSTLSMRKGDDGGEKNGKKKKKIMMKIVATNVVASRPPERQPTATPTARAN